MSNAEKQAAQAAKDAQRLIAPKLQAAAAAAIVAEGGSEHDVVVAKVVIATLIPFMIGTIHVNTQTMLEEFIATLERLGKAADA